MSTQPAEPAPFPGRPAPAHVDSVDRRLLQLLADDGRMPVSALATRAGISRAGAYARIERLRTEGVIEGFTIRVDPRRLGLGVSALILVSGQQTHWRALRERLAAMPEVEYCAFVTGEYDALMLVRVADVETLRDVILERLQTMDDVRATETIFILDELVRRPLLMVSP
ncbi:MAG: Lrp/AsnC family transcriptional regulator [Candidatus Dormibacteria bacterium]